MNPTSEMVARRLRTEKNPIDRELWETIGKALDMGIDVCKELDGALQKAKEAKGIK